MNDRLDITAAAIAFICLAAWLPFIKFTSRRWRFEFFTIDLALGALLAAAIAAFTLGNFAGDLGLGDRFLVASKTSQALVFLAGGLAGLGLLGLFAAIRLLGITAASTVAFSLAALIFCSVTLTSNQILLSAASLGLFLAATLLGAKASRGQDAPLPPMKNARQPAPLRLRQSSKGILLALASGIFLGGALPVELSGTSGDFGLGPYAGVLVSSIGALLSSGLFSLFLLNIAIDLPPSTLKAYWSKAGAGKSNHRVGILGGCLLAAGCLAYLVWRNSSVAETATAPSIAPGILPALALTAGVFSGVVWWKEASLTKSKGLLFLAALLFAGGALCSALATAF